MIPKTHRRVVLARRPPGEPSETDFRIEEVAVPEPGSGQVLVRVIYLSLDPYMRGRMRDAASYAAPVGIGDVMTGGTVGEVVKSNNPNFKVGDIVEERLGGSNMPLVARHSEGSIRRLLPSPPPMACSGCPV